MSKLKSISVYHNCMPSLEFYGKIEEREDGFVIVIPSDLSGIAKV